MFQTPAVILSVLIASICAALFYFWQGKALRNLAAYWVASVLGFLAGQWLAISFGFSTPVLGQIHILEGLFFSILANYLVKFAKI